MSWSWLLFLTNKICSQDLNYTIGPASKLLMTASQEKDGSLVGLTPFLNMLSKDFFPYTVKPEAYCNRCTTPPKTPNKNLTAYIKKVIQF